MYKIRCGGGGGGDGKGGGEGEGEGEEGKGKGEEGNVTTYKILGSLEILAIKNTSLFHCNYF